VDYVKPKCDAFEINVKVSNLEVIAKIADSYAKNADSRVFVDGDKLKYVGDDKYVRYVVEEVENVLVYSARKRTNKEEIK